VVLEQKPKAVHLLVVLVGRVVVAEMVGQVELAILRLHLHLRGVMEVTAQITHRIMVVVVAVAHLLLAIMEPLRLAVLAEMERHHQYPARL